MSRRRNMQGATQTTRDLLMIRPAHFGPNPQTAASNVFQRPTDRSPASVKTAALAEFEGMVHALQEVGARVIVIDDTAESVKPDAVFPNNWFTTHANGDVFLFPLEAPVRRAERRREIIEALSAEHGFDVARIVDLSGHEHEDRFLEGTGSMVLDRVNHVVYAATSSRTHLSVLRAFVRDAGFEPCEYTTSDDTGRPIYHTNVMMSLGRRFAVLCVDAIAASDRRDALIRRLEGTGRQVIAITMEQMAAFAGNLLEIRGYGEEPFIVLSRTALDAFTDEQRITLKRYGTLLPVTVDTIEKVGGGSVRCMLAEIFLPRAEN